MTTTYDLRLAPRRDEDLTVAIPFGEAALCLDCSVIFHVGLGHCPRCAGAAFVLVARWTERMPQVPRSVAAPSERYAEGSLVHDGARGAFNEEPR